MTSAERDRVLAARACVDLTAAKLDTQAFPVPDWTSAEVGDGALVGIQRALGDAHVVIRALALDDGSHVAVFASCADTACSAGLVRATEGQPWTIDVRAALSIEDMALGDDGEGLLVQALARGDLSGDGQDELWLMYSALGRPEPAVGPTERSYLAAFELPTLAPMLWTDVTVTPGGSYGDACDAHLGVLDVDCDIHLDIVLVKECGMALCLGGSEDAECEEQTVTHTRAAFFWNPGDSAYVELTARSFTPSSERDDAKRAP